MAIVYQATNLVNGKCYIGVTKESLDRRRRAHNSCARRENTRSLFHKAIRKYGPDNFRWLILAINEDYGAALKIEITLISIFKPEYNLTGGGQGTLGLKMSPEAKKKCLETRKRNGTRSYPRSELWRQRAKESATGRPGYWTGKKRSPEDVQKAALARRGKKLNLKPEFRAMRREYAAAARAHILPKPILCIADGAPYISAVEAARTYGVTPAAITHVLKGRARSAAGRKFVYIEDFGNGAA